MELIHKIERGGLIGLIYKEKLGYTYKIKTRIDGKITIVARSYVYLSKKERTRELMEKDMDVILDISPLFNINDYRKD